ncbi:MAG TPA: DUF169 domain-containing protein [Thermodesulfobacteriota bacterium]|nr:DUF169 domain-containing protein [Thermodesulfobacteriota bacterium]
MGTWAEKSESLKAMLRLRTEPVAFRRLEKAEELGKIANVVRPQRGFTYCQVPFLVRVLGQTIGITRDDRMGERCARLHGLRPPTEKSMHAEAEMLATTWFATPEQALQQQKETPRVPVGEAIVAAPLAREKFEPEVISIYANPAQVMMILCGMQKEKYERFQFFFIGEGACADSLAQCYTTGRTAVAIPCYGERAMGQVMDDEMVVAVPPLEVERILAGLKKLARIGFRYPIAFIGGLADPAPVLAQFYPDLNRKKSS